MARFRLMDKLTCVQCGAVTFQPSVGKSSRSFLAQCDPECEGRVLNVASKDESAGKPADVPKGGKGAR